MEVCFDAELPALREESHFFLSMFFGSDDWLFLESRSRLARMVCGRAGGSLNWSAMFWSRKHEPAKPIDSDEILMRAVRLALGPTDESTVKIVTAIAGLLSAVAYADRQIGPEEAAHLREELARLHHFPRAQVEAVAQVLHEQALRLSTAFVPRFTRALREELPEESRVEVLDALLGMAATDGVITHDEVVSLRNMSSGLGLSQEHYNALQEKYRDKLAWRSPLGPIHR